MKFLSGPEDEGITDGSLFAFNVYILGVHVELYLKKVFHCKC